MFLSERTDAILSYQRTREALIHFAGLFEKDQIVLVTEALLTTVGPCPTPHDLRALSAIALDTAQLLQVALGDRPMSLSGISESYIVPAA